MDEHGWLGPIEWAAVGRPRPGEVVSGDRSIAISAGTNGALFGVVDGLGHGWLAATAATSAVEVVDAAPTEPLADLMQLCHRALTETRGAAITLARINFDTDTLSWIGVGNVTANLIAKRPGGVEVRSSVRLAGGIIGFRMPDGTAPQEVSITHGDLVVITSDGISDGYLDTLDFAASAPVIAEHILAAHSKESDDALVLAARHRGASS
jgi:negative regulator of sigma-B (phosphoserine phosphatase)